jgi:hypothetical protein
MTVNVIIMKHVKQRSWTAVMQKRASMFVVIVPESLKGCEIMMVGTACSQTNHSG